MMASVYRRTKPRPFIGTVPPEHAQAVRWYRAAAKQGNAPAQLNLGMMYHEGLGVPQDLAAAHMWFDLAATNGIAEAAAQRDLVSREMTATTLAEAVQRARACLASDCRDCN